MTAFPAAVQIAADVRAGHVSAGDVLEAHLARIEEANPRLGALSVVFVDRAREAAALVDRAVADGVDPGPLAGVPVSVKENIDLTWSATTQGWRGAAHAVPACDATIVRRVRAAGAVPIGRGNMPDFGMRWDTDNDLFGRTFNPWDPTRSAGGSSGGDAVSVATGMSTLGLGNDFGGSLRLPAFAAGVCGLRPSLGRVPRAAVTEQSVSLTLQRFAVNGPLARTVGDLSVALDVLQGRDAADPVSEHPHDLSESAPRRIGVIDPAALGCDAEVAASVDQAARVLAGAGWAMERIVPPHLEEAAVLWRRLACTDMLLTLGPSALSQPLGRSATMFLRDSTAAAEPYERAADYAAAWGRRAVIEAEWRRLQDDVPLILGPVSATVMREIDYDLPGGTAATAAWRALHLTVVANFLGLPAAAVPTGLGTSVLPVGVQLIGPRTGDRLALSAAADVEAGVPRIGAPPGKVS